MNPADSAEQSGTTSLLDRLWGSTAAREGVRVLASQVISVAVSLGTDVVLFRGLSIEERGVLSASLGLRAVLFFIADMGLSLTMVRVGAEYFGQEKRAEAAQVFRRMLLLRMSLAVAVAVLCSLLAALLAKFPLAAPGRAHLIYASALGLIGMAAVGWGVDVAKAERRFGALFSQRVIEALLRAAAVVALVVTAANMNTLPAETVLWALAAAGVLAGAYCILSQRRSLAAAAGLDAAAEQELSRRIASFSRYAAASELLLALAGYADLFMLQLSRDATETAVYDGARRLALLLPLLAMSADSVLLPRAAALSGAAACRAYIRKTLKVALPLALVSAGGLALAASVLVPLLWGERYAASIPPLRWLCMAYGLQIILTALNLVLYPLRREGLVVAINALNLVFTLGLGLWLIPLHGPLGAAWAALGARVALLIISALAIASALRQEELNAR